MRGSLAWCLGQWPSSQPKLRTFSTFAAPCHKNNWQAQHSLMKNDSTATSNNSENSNTKNIATIIIAIHMIEITVRLAMK